METKKIVSKIVNDYSLLDFLYSLKERWKDEKQYENFNEYEKAIKKNVKYNNVKFIKAIQKPFGFICLINNMKVKIFINGQKQYTNLAAKKA